MYLKVRSSSVASYGSESDVSVVGGSYWTEHKRTVPLSDSCHGVVEH